ncbi:hypothetical protein FJ444_08770 [Aestuariibacter sp. GS-14]|uniref:hypothetical protein n=1 Tax=Alteromonadaceae TaxID=72275 RepID=UPI0011290816|nr:hypothetical protein [Aestuariibacter sp. GS-14]TPV59131.1 hypothetical protein FJ444_08770 [Aestuariibacter sp. GS-14]
MRQPTQNEQPDTTESPLRNAPAGVLGLALMGFVLLITGVLMFVITTIEALTQHEDTRTIISVLVGLGMYRAGKMVLQKVGKFKLPPDRRRSVLS